jgi:hypothetical protein
MKKVLSILGILIVVAVMAIFGYVKYQNKETIVDLGNGWKSYHYNQTGITVKIPKDATVTKDYSYTKGAHGVFLSDGVIEMVVAQKMVVLQSTHDGNLAYKRNVKELREKVKKGVVKKYTEFGMKNGRKIRIKQTTKEKFCEFLIEDKVSFLRYTDDKFDGEKIYKLNKDITLIIPGYKRQHSVGIDMDLVHKQYPYLDEIPFKDRCEEYIKIIKPYILEIDNF